MMADNGAAGLALPPLALENGFRRAQTDSAEERVLLAAGYCIVERDDRTTILRPARRAGDRKVTNGDLLKWRRLEREVWERIAAEFQEMGRDVDADSLRWASEQFRVRIMRAGTGKAQVNGRAE
jgi:hypothetical protein